MSDQTFRDLHRGVEKIIERNAANDRTSATLVGIDSNTVTVVLAGSKTPTVIDKPVGFNGNAGDIVSLDRNPRTSRWEIPGAATYIAAANGWNTLTVAALSFDVGALPTTGETLVIEVLLKAVSGVQQNAAMRFNNDATAAGYIYAYAGSIAAATASSTSILIAGGTAGVATADQFNYSKITIPMFRESGYRKQAFIAGGTINQVFTTYGYWGQNVPITSVQILQNLTTVNLIVGCRWRVTAF